MTADGFNPVMAMLDLIDTLSACRDNGCGCANDEHVETARDVVEWLTRELTERKMRSRQRPYKRPSTPSSKASSAHRPPPSSTPIVHPSSNKVDDRVDNRVDNLSLPLGSEISDLLQKSRTSEEGHHQESGQARANGATVHPPSTALDDHADERLDDEPDEDVDGAAEDDRVYRSMVNAWDPFGGAALSGTYRARLKAMVPLMRRIGGKRGEAPETCWAAAVQRFKSDAGVRKKRLGLPTLCDQILQWVEDDEPGPPTPALRALPTREDYEREAAADRAQGGA